MKQDYRAQYKKFSRKLRKEEEKRKKKPDTEPKTRAKRQKVARLCGVTFWGEVR